MREKTKEGGDDEDDAAKLELDKELMAQIDALPARPIQHVVSGLGIQQHPAAAPFAVGFQGGLVSSQLGSLPQSVVAPGSTATTDAQVLSSLLNIEQLANNTTQQLLGQQQHGIVGGTALEQTLLQQMSYQQQQQPSQEYLQVSIKSVERGQVGFLSV